MLRLIKMLLMVALLGSLVTACGGGEPASSTATVPTAALDTVVVFAAENGGERVFDGTVEAVQQAVLAAQTSGRVVALERDVDDPVARGALILKISSVEQKARLEEARQALTGAQAVMTEATLRYERTRQLVAAKLLSQADLDRTTAERDAAAARRAAAEAGVAAAREQFGYTEVRAPFAGVITNRYVEVGESVNPGQPLTAVAALGALRVHVDVPQALADEIRGLGSARVYAGARTIESAGLTVFPAAESGSNTVRVRIDLPPGVADLYPGMYIKVGFLLGQAPILRVPAAVVMRRSEVTAVYVVDNAGAVSLRQVRLGRQLGEEFEVLSGLAAGERVATDPVAATLLIEKR